DSGPEAKAWNDLLSQTQKLREQTLAETAREALGSRRQSRGDLDHACDAIAQGMLIVDENFRIKYANGATAVFLQSKREQMTGADARELIKDATVRDAIAGVIEGKGSARRAVEV